MQFLKIVSDLDRIELAMAELYEWCAALFAQDRAAADLFIHLRLEELSHRNILDYERRLAMDNPDRFRIIGTDPRALDDALAAVSRFRGSHPDPSLAEAVETALTLEQGAAELYYQTLDGRAPADMARFISHLHAGCRTHIRRLADFASDRDMACLPDDGSPNAAPPGR
jgi:flavin-binding protein dodecin